VPVRNTFEVGLDLGTRRESVAPLGVRLERVAVEVGGNVTRDPRICILPPSATQSIGLLVDREIIEAGRPELDRRQDAGHAGPKDCEAQGLSFPGSLHQRFLSRSWIRDEPGWKENENYPKEQEGAPDLAKDAPSPGEFTPERLAALSHPLR